MKRLSLFFALVFAFFVSCGGGETTEDTVSGNDIVSNDTVGNEEATTKDVVETSGEETTTGEDVIETSPEDEGSNEGNDVIEVEEKVEEVCTPNCEGKECGDDGCGGSCGTCDGGKLCVEGKCSDAPEFGKGSRFNWMYLPYGQTEEENTSYSGDEGTFECLDLNGDGIPDNGIAALLAQVKNLAKMDANEEINAKLDDKSINLIVEFPKDVDITNYGPFDLKGYLGEYDETEDGYYIKPESFDENGDPMFSFADTKITDNEVSGGPSDFYYAIPVQDLVLNLKIKNATFKATTVSSSDFGVALTNGVIGGIIYKEDIHAALQAAKEYCDSAPEPKPEACQYMGLVADPNIIDSFIQYDMEDGEAVSVCMFFTTEEAKILGIYSE